jgi:L-threonylcarbamoyladenylate synthase
MIGNNMGLAARLIREGKLVAFPTETVYGLGANAFDPFAVARIFEVKQRPTFDPLIVHIASFNQLDSLFANPILPDVAKLAEAFWPGPLTIVHTKQSCVPDLVSSGLTTVAVRMPSHPVALQLIEQAGCPIAAPSANRFGCLSPTTAQHVAKQLNDVDYILDGGSTTIGIESTVVAVTENGVSILRKGAVTKEALSAVVDVVDADDERSDLSMPAPGMLKSHYSPQKPLYVIDVGVVGGFPPQSGVIVNHKDNALRYKDVIVMPLSSGGDLNDMAVNLFAVLHAMEDNPDVAQIFIEPVMAKGIGVAIMDRILKASYNYRK